MGLFPSPSVPLPCGSGMGLAARLRKPTHSKLSYTARCVRTYSILRWYWSSEM